MGVLFGTNIAVNGVSNASEWRIKYSGMVKPWTGSGSQNGTIRGCNAMKDWQGQYRALGHTPWKLPGEDFTFTGSIDGSTGATGAAIVEKTEILWHQEEHAYFEHAVHFASNGALTIGSAAATDSTVPQPVCSDENCVIKLGGADQGDIRFAQLDIMSNIKPYGSVKTAGVKKRLKGPIDAELTYGTYIAATSALPTMGTLYVASLYVGLTANWELTWMKIVDVDILAKTQEYIAAVVTAQMAGQQSGSIGSIKTPAGATYWPE